MDIRKTAGRVCGLVMAAVSLFHVQAHSEPQLPEQELWWKNVSVNNKKTTVFCMFKDSRGIMWLGTNGGLFFFDGAGTHPVGEVELLGSQVYSLVEHGGRLYAGSNNGLFYFDYASGVVAPCELSTPNEIRTLLLVDDDLWIGGLNGICKYGLKNNEMSDFTEGLPHRSVYSILRDSRGVLYAGTYNGVARWDSRGKIFKPLKTHGNFGNHTLFANCMLETDDNESIYIGCEGSLLKYTPANDHWAKISAFESTNIKSLSKGENGHILVGTDDGVFDLFNDATKHYRHDSRHELSLADNEIWCIYADEQHNVWAGHERGFSIASNSAAIRTIKLSTLALSGEGNEIHSIYRDRNHNIWFAGTNGAIRFSGHSAANWYRHSEAANSLSHNRIRAITEDSANNIWFATDGGINKHNPLTEGFDVYYATDRNGDHKTNWVYALVEDGDNLWVGSFLNGLHCVPKASFGSGGGTVAAELSVNTNTPNGEGISLANNLVNNVIKDAQGNLWILLFRDNTLAKYTPSTGQMMQYDIYELAGGYPTHICADRQGQIWCAFKGGVLVFHGNGRQSIVKFPYTNSDETVMAMGKVGSGVWVSTQSNVWNIGPDALKAELLPIPQKPYTAVYEDTVARKVYLGGTDEIIEVDSSIMGSNIDYKNIKLVLTANGDGQLNLSGLNGAANGLSIPYGGGVRFVVSTLDYSPESVQRYMYKLSDSAAGDSDEGWIVMPEGANTITFSDLKMGDYKVLVKAVDSPATPVSIPLSVEAPLLLSWWALLIYILIGAGIVYWIVWYTRKKNLRDFQEQERQKALENVERKLSFLSNISHDLKTPLSMILGPVSLLKERIKDPESRKSLETVYDNAVRLNNMIHRTLELQQIEDTDENLLIRSTFDVVEFCKGVFEAFKENNPQKKFVFHSSCTQIRIEADAVKFESVITNLLSNACKYSDEGATISIGIDLRGNNVEIIVADDGVGIADMDQPLVFQRMFRAPATSKLREGTGLGLYLIKRYLELMGGNINLYSREGQGTSFVVLLPISEKIIPENDNDSAPAGDKPKILIIDDNLQISGFIKEMLSGKFTYLTAENGRSGLAIAASFAPDLIIVDEMMPIMNGLEMVRRMKQNPRLAPIPIIMLTAKSDNRTETDSIKLGIDVFMAKPFEPAALLGRINQLLKTRSEIKERVRIQAIAEAEAKPIEAESVTEKSLAKIAKIIEENISDPDLNVNLLCEKSGIPNKQLYRLIKKYMGMAPLDHIRSVRLQKAAVLLSQHRFTVAEISYMVGFKTPSYFAKCFQSQFGVKPSQYQSDDVSTK